MKIINSKAHNLMTNIFKKKFSLKNKGKAMNQFFSLPKFSLPKDRNFMADNAEEGDSVLKMFKTNTDLDREDMVKKVLKKRKLEVDSEVTKFFSDMDTKESIKVTENLIEKLRLRKEIKFTKEYKQSQILNEYGNYDRYFTGMKKNVTERGYASEDDGEEIWQKKFQELKEKYLNPLERKNKELGMNYQLDQMLKSDLKSKNFLNYNLIDFLKNTQEENLEFHDSKVKRFDLRNIVHQKVFQHKFRKPIKNKYKKPYLSFKTQSRKNKPFFKGNEEDEPIKEFSSNELLNRYHFAKKRLPIPKDSAVYESFLAIQESNLEIDKPLVQSGRVSPWVKEDIYREFLQGWTVKDLSYKYGLLPERVKVIVWCRDLFWREIYPKIGDQGLKELLDIEFLYASRFGFIDYGKDLEVMAERERGIHIKNINRSLLDSRPNEHDIKLLSGKLKNYRPCKYNSVIEKFIGKGPHGYLVKNMVVNRGLGKKRVSIMFERFCKRKDFIPHTLPEKIVRRKMLGPRLA